MLTHLKVKNFAIVKDLDIDFKPGMTSITGETGAGKSIAIDALTLCLGGRAEASSVRTGESKAEINAEFDVTASESVKNFFDDNELSLDDDTVIIRRIINADGKSKAFINGTAVTLSQLKSLGELLIIIHGQHAHQLLFKSDYQADILDKYGNFAELKKNLGILAHNVQKFVKQLREMEENREQFNAKKDLLHFQLDELRKADPKEKEYEELEQEYNKLANVEEIQNNCSASLQYLEDNEISSALNAVRSALKAMEKVAEVDPSLSNVIQMLNDAEISIEESYDEIHNYSEGIEYDPERMAFLEKRIATYEDLSQKYHVSPNTLFELYEKVKKEFALMNNGDESVDNIRENLQKATDDYLNLAKELSSKRNTCAKELSHRVTSHMHDLAMPFGEFSIEIKFDQDKQPSAKGNDEINFLVKINPGQDPAPLNAVVSGGELSRISLAIQEIHAEKVQTPTLIFDEVDTGISGQTANVVGKLLYNLGNSAQVLCVTHLPQVAAQAKQQLYVSKQVIDEKTETSMVELSTEERIKEIARLLSGDHITDNSLASAKDLLAANIKN